MTARKTQKKSSIKNAAGKKGLIALKPIKWTKHHTHRVLHISGLIVALVSLVSACAVFGTKLAETQAVDTVLNSGVGVRVAEVGEGPAVIDDSGTTSGSSSQSPNPQPLAGASYVVINSDKVFSTQYPHFVGHSNIKNALIHFLVESKYTVSGNVYSDANGDWEWTPPSPLAAGEHKLTVTATDQKEPKISVTNTFLFSVKLGPGQSEESPVHHNIVDLNNKGNLFDVIVSVPEQFKTITVGDELVTRIKFVNFGRAGHPVDVEAQYVIRNSEGKIVVQSSQTVAVATQISIIKSFYTNKNMDPGTYTITVSVPSEDLIASSTDTFTVKDIAPAAAPIAPVNYTLTLQILAGMIFLFTLITYLEYNKVEVLSTLIKQVSETDLLGQN